MEKSIFPFFSTLPHLRLQTTTTSLQGTWDSVIDIKKERTEEKFKYEKICVTLKFMAEQYYFVCMCLPVIRDGHMNPLKKKGKMVEKGKKEY
jgi:hypothetical protein